MFPNHVVLVREWSNGPASERTSHDSDLARRSLF
jgi:hypothetical protein